MTEQRTPARIYDTADSLDAADRVTQIRHLAVIGIAARLSAYQIANLDTAYVSLFEVIARLADEVEGDIEDMAAATEGGEA